MATRRVSEWLSSAPRLRVGLPNQQAVTRRVTKSVSGSVSGYHWAAAAVNVGGLPEEGRHFGYSSLTFAMPGDFMTLPSNPKSVLPIIDRYRAIRGLSQRIQSPLSAEDCGIQSMPDASPTRWHLAHTTWFFETFVLKQLPGYEPLDERFEYLFNSYYNTVGEQFPRHQRGLISRPGLQQTLDYRAHVDQHMESILAGGDDRVPLDVVELGLQHEQQHQELMLTDIKHALSINPTQPVYAATESCVSPSTDPVQWRHREEGIASAGLDGAGFSFDNESPRHRTLLAAHSVASRLVTCGEYLEFMDDGGYQRPEFWLSQGWATVKREGWDRPLYWSVGSDGAHCQFRLDGVKAVDLNEPVCHVSFFEADAYARWAGKRLPTEFEWENAAQEYCESNPQWRNKNVFADHLLAQGRTVHPQSSSTGDWMGSVWEWTASQYVAYPGFQPASGALGEYNGKFMCNQFVLRGGSCATSSSHIRPQYRNFFPPDARWQFSGIRLTAS